MPFRLVWTRSAAEAFNELQAQAQRAEQSRERAGVGKSSKAQGLFKQLVKCVELLADNPRHPGLKTHEFRSLEHPYESDGKVFEAYVQNRTPGAYRVFWCYGPQKGQITLIAITPHP